MTINEIAELAGVSRATVSRYLNKGYVSEEKKEKIRRVVEETGYHPSASAQTLRSRKTRMIGTIIPKIASDPIGRMISGVSEVLKQSGYKLLLADTLNDPQEELRYLDFFKHNQVDGVILFGTILTPRHYELIRKLSIPVVVIGQKAEEVPSVYQNDYQSMYELTMEMLKSTRKAAYIGAPDADVATGTTRKRAFGDAMITSGFQLGDVLWKQGDFSIDCGYRLMEEILREMPDVDTVICATDAMATGAIMYCNEHGIRIPEQIQFAGTGNENLGIVIQPQLTTVTFEYQKAGLEAAKLMTRLLRGEEAEETKICMPYHIEYRSSKRASHT